MTDESDLMREAFAALRERHDGTHPEEDATLQRALLATRRKKRRTSIVRWIVLPAAAVLVASTAWAGATGHVPSFVRTMIDAVRSDRDRVETPVATTTVTTTSTATSAPPPAPPPPTTTSEPEPPPTVAAVPAPRPSLRIASAPPPAPTPTAPPASSAPADPNAELFADAHRIHFVEKDPARAVDAWDAYLRASPNGRFVPEAKYNRAIALVRVGRRSEATRELQAFADGAYGSYRRDEARALLEALAKDATP